MTVSLPPWVFHVRLMHRYWNYLNPDWLCTMSYGNTQSTGTAPTPDEAYNLALTAALSYTPPPVYKPSLNLEIDL